MTIEDGTLQQTKIQRRRAAFFVPPNDRQSDKKTGAMQTPVFRKF
jgi:hypothetical protein